MANALVARNATGEVRAWVKFDDEPWKVTELADLLGAWAKTDPERRVSMEAFEPTTAMPSFNSARPARRIEE